jgi:hypothetical protein
MRISSTTQHSNRDSEQINRGALEDMGDKQNFREESMCQEKIIIVYDTTTGKDTWNVEILGRNIDGKYCRILDSNDADFPFDISKFGPFEEDILIMQLKETYPGTEISLKW